MTHWMEATSKYHKTGKENPTMKQKLYKTAKALISCANFKSGDFVSVEYYFTDEHGKHWYICNGNVAYPENHLAEFCL